MTVRVGDPLREIQLPTLGGGVWRSSDRASRPTVLFCFATW